MTIADALPPTATAPGPTARAPRRRARALKASLWALALSTLSAGAWAQTSLKLIASDGFQEDYFGVDVAISGGTAIVGARLDDDNGSQSGSVYVFNAATGAELRKLTALDGAAFDLLGDHVALEGTTALVSAGGDDDNGPNSGSAYVFNVATGQQLRKLLPTDGAPEDRFGSAVDVGGGLGIVGAFGDDDLGENSGSAYVFDLSTGQQVAKLLAADGEEDDYFGISVAISGGLALVGAYGEDSNGVSSGAAYLFDAATGQQLRKITPDVSAPIDFFGTDVDLEGQRAAVSSLRSSGFIPGDPAVYVFDVATGGQLFELIPSEDPFGTAFGSALAMDEERVLVGAPSAAIGGVAWEFDLATGVELGKLVPTDPEPGDAFGYALALDGGRAIVGAFLEDELGDQAGAAYLLPLTETLGAPDPTCVAVPNSTGLTGTLTGLGSPSVPLNDCTLAAASLPPTQATLLLASRTSLFTPFAAGNSNGNLCIGGVLGRFLQQVTLSSAAGRADFTVDLTAIPLGTGAVAVLPGDTWYFQAWHRDTQGPRGNNLTGSLCVTFQ